MNRVSGYRNGRRVVVKVGSSLLVESNGELRQSWLDSLADDIAAEVGDDRQLLVVSSGSIALGCRALGIGKRRARLEDLQAAAAAGQTQLVNAWQHALARHDVATAQVLLTPGDTEHRRRFLNARSTLSRLLDHGVVPVINENDTVATEEIRYGDNDRLAARVAQLVMADTLILLSDVDGLYSADPQQDATSRHIARVDTIDAGIVAIAGETRSAIGTGGMATKVQAAQIATRAGCTTIVASGQDFHPLRSLAGNARHTVFTAEGSPAAARKQWLAGRLDVVGELRLDDGAVRALRNGGSLLPVGVREISGEFSRGDVVRLVDARQREIGRGLAEYSAAEASQIKGVQSEQIEHVLGYRGRTVMVHRDELVLFGDD